MRAPESDSGNEASSLPPRVFEVDDDSLLLEMTGRGDDRALRLLVLRWQAPLINFMRRSVRDVRTAEELTQQVFVKLWRNSPHYRPQSKFAAYLFTVARSVLIGEHRRRVRKPAVLTNPADLEASSSDASVRFAAEFEETFALALESLPESHRTALLLLKQQELSYEEIAGVMGVSVSAVKTWVFRGRARLRQLMAEYDGTRGGPGAPPD